MEDFTKVLSELHQAYVQHMLSPGNKPGQSLSCSQTFSFSLRFDLVLL